MPTTTHRTLPYPAGTAIPDVPADIQALATALDGVAIDTQGTFAARPAAGSYGKYYWATDTTALYRDNGTAWVQIIISTDTRLTDTRTPTDNTVSTIKLQNNAVTAAKIEVQPAWQTVTLTGTTWTNAGSTLGLEIHKDTLGNVRCRGYASSAALISNSTVLANIPAGYRPGQGFTTFLVNSTTGTATFVPITLLVNGDIKPVPTAGLAIGTWSFDVIQHYRAEN